MHTDHRLWTRRQRRAWAGGKTHRLVGLKQNMELYGTMGRGLLLITSSASTSFFPSAWLSRSTLPPTSIKATKLGVQLINPHHASHPWAIPSKLQPQRLMDPYREGHEAKNTASHEALSDHSQITAEVGDAGLNQL